MHFGYLDIQDFPAKIAQIPPGSTAAHIVAPHLPGTALHEVEKKHIFETLSACRNNKTRAAQQLGISLKTLHNKLAKYREE